MIVDCAGHERYRTATRTNKEIGGSCPKSCTSRRGTSHQPRRQVVSHDAKLFPQWHFPSMRMIGCRLTNLRHFPTIEVYVHVQILREGKSHVYLSIRYSTPARVSSGPACACTEKSFFSS